MDVKNLIKDQIERISGFEKSIFLDSILLHLDRAEYYYNLGETDSYYYNDVIYRTNQAFEGTLKEAYKILAEKDSSQVIKETPNQIEKYFEKEGIFKERVLELFKNYRNQWRNESTHDFKLFFDSNEAFIAISNVSSFTYLLMKQIIEKIAYQNEQEKIKNSKKSTIENKKEGLKVAHGIFEIVSLLLSDTIKFDEIRNDKLTESEIIGFLKANFSTYLSFATVENDIKLGSHLRPDFIIKENEDRLILEVKKFGSVIDEQSMIFQILAYMKYANIKDGIILALNVTKSFSSMEINEYLPSVDNEEYRVRVIHN